jgi:hypothetical protein
VRLETKNASIHLDADTIAALKSKWRTKDVDAQLLAMHLWLLRNKARRPVNVWRFLDSWLAKAPAVIRPPMLVESWWSTPERVVNQGLALGIQARPGESLAALKDRISAALQRSAA